jgi:hypothetical protein
MRVGLFFAEPRIENTFLDARAPPRVAPFPLLADETPRVAGSPVMLADGPPGDAFVAHGGSLTPGRGAGASRFWPWRC